MTYEASADQTVNTDWQGKINTKHGYAKKFKAESLQGISSVDIYISLDDSAKDQGKSFTLFAADDFNENTKINNMYTSAEVTVNTADYYTLDISSAGLPSDGTVLLGYYENADDDCLRDVYCDVVRQQSDKYMADGNVYVMADTSSGVWYYHENNIATLACRFNNPNITDTSEKEQTMEEKPLDRRITDAGSMSVFSSVTCIGDSLTSGVIETKDADGKTVYNSYKETSYPTVMSGILGYECKNLGAGGTTAYPGTDISWMTKAEARSWFDEAYRSDCYIIALGTNDILVKGEFSGDVSTDIKDDYTKNAQTSVGGYAAIIQRILKDRPQAKIFCVTLPYTRHSETILNATNPKIRAIAQKFGCYTIDLQEYGIKKDDASEWKETYYTGGHLNAKGYEWLARTYISYIDYIIRNASADPEKTTNTDAAIKVTINGTALDFDVAPQIINDRTMVPMRKIFEELGAEVTWDESTRTITSTKDGTTIKMVIGDDEMDVNYASKEIDSAPTIIDGRTLVPLRAISEALFCEVGWDASTRTASISMQEKPKLRVLCVSDIHEGAWREESGETELGRINVCDSTRIKVLVDSINQETAKNKIDLVIIAGDLLSLRANEGEEKEDKKLERLKIFKKDFVDKVNVPVFCTIGNHDWFNNEEWKSVMGYDIQYTHEIGDYAFIFTDVFSSHEKETADKVSQYSNFEYDGVGEQMPEEAAWLKGEISKAEQDKKKIFIVAHYYNEDKDGWFGGENGAFATDPNIIGDIIGHSHRSFTSKKYGKLIISSGNFGYCVRTDGKSDWYCEGGKLTGDFDKNGDYVGTANTTEADYVGKTLKDLRQTLYSYKILDIGEKSIDIHSIYPEITYQNFLGGYKQEYHADDQHFDLK